MEGLCSRRITRRDGGGRHAHQNGRPAIIIPAAGELAALLAIFVPAFGRLFLHGARCEAEVGVYAEALFLRRELFKTPHRDGRRREQ